MLHHLSQRLGPKQASWMRTGTIVSRVSVAPYLIRGVSHPHPLDSKTTPFLLPGARFYSQPRKPKTTFPVALRKNMKGPKIWVGGFLLLGMATGITMLSGSYKASKKSMTKNDLEELATALDLDGANEKLRNAEAWHAVPHGGRVTQAMGRRDMCYTVRLASNSPIEDDMDHNNNIDVGDMTDWKAWGIYDGHAGWQTSRTLRAYLISYVSQEIFKIGSNKTPVAVESAIKSGFLKLDDAILSNAIDAMKNPTLSHAKAVQSIAPANAGSCALLAIYDPTTSNLRVACTGDSRAILARKVRSSDDGEEGRWIAIPLSADQTGFNALELSRINNAHPGESPIDLKSGRLLGIAVTRAFGDSRWKWPAKTIDENKSRFYGKSKRPHYVSPPYMTAEPVVESVKTQNGDVLIMASDGFWDHMSSADAANCIGMWMDQPGHKRVKDVSTPPTKEQRASGFNWDWKVKPDEFICTNNHAAGHLVRNVFGGKNTERFCSVMSLQAPESRYVRDDITVNVVVFGGDGMS